MLLLEDFTKRAEKTVKRQKVRHSLNSQIRSGSGKGETVDLVNEKEKAGAGSAGNAVYTFEGATGDGNDSAFSRRCVHKGAHLYNMYVYLYENIYV